MNDLGIALITFACTFGCALAATYVRDRMPPEHLTRESQDVVRLGIGLVATMTALLLGLVTAAAKGGFDAQDVALKSSAANILTLDRQLARYGDEAQPIRVLIKQTVETRAAELSRFSSDDSVLRSIPRAGAPIEEIESLILALQPQTESQRYFRAESLKLVQEVVRTRWRILETGPTVQFPFVCAVIFWLTVTFSSFGLFAPRNPTVLCVLFVASLSVAAAVFLVLEMDSPFSGVIRVSDDAFRFALGNLGQ
jgi:hypothetical protein